MPTKPMDLDVVEHRFVLLETKVTYQEKTIADLNEVLIDQNRLLEKMGRRVTRLEEQLEALLGQLDAPPEKPPHY